MIHPDHLRRALSARQMAEWEEYSKLEPFGQPRGDMQAGIVAAAVRASFGGQTVDPRAFSIDHLIEKDLGPIDELDAQQKVQLQLKQFQAFAMRQAAEKKAKEKGEMQRVLVPKGQKPPGRVIAPRRTRR